MKVFSLGLTLLGAALTASATECAVSIVKRGGGLDVSYTLSSAPAIVTMEVETNSPAGWVSIGGQNFTNVTGTINQYVSTVGPHTFRWNSKENWPDHVVRDSGLRVVVTKWELEDPPLYLVADLRKDAPDGVRYYVDESHLPGASVLDERYRRTHLLMKKVTAKNVPWTMGSIYEGDNHGAGETPHTVVLDHNYYLGVFLFTLKQARQIDTNLGNRYSVDADLRPAEGSITYHYLRGSTEGDTTSTERPTANSFLGKLKTRTGLQFDLPAESEWEFAAKAGAGEGYWPNGEPMLNSGWSDTGSLCYRDSNLDHLARYRSNGGVPLDGVYGKNVPGYYPSSVGPTNSTAICGSYPPNRWGFYDMLGNLREWCIDWYQQDITALNGAIVTERSADATEARVVRGGSFRDTAGKCRPSYRSGTNPKYSLAGWDDADGFRVRLTCEAQ